MRASAASLRARRYVESALVLLLIVTAYLARRHGLPHNGLFFDDALTAAATRAPISKLFTFSLFGEAGFVALLKTVGSATGFNSSALAYPALIAGVVGPAVFYLVLTRVGFARSVSALLAAILLVNRTHLQYSGRAKSYVIDPLVILGLFVALPLLANQSWNWRRAAIYAIAAAALASFSPFVLVAVLACGVVLVFQWLLRRRDNATDDGFQRLAALSAVIGAQIILYSLTTPTSATGLTNTWGSGFDAFVKFDLNPIGFLARIWTHLVRIAEVFPGGGHVLASIGMALALAGLAFTAWRERSSTSGVRAQYFLAMLLFALIGGAFRKFPFGPTPQRMVAKGVSYVRTGVGGRVSLWLVPAIAIGIAIVLQSVRSTAARRIGTTTAFDAIALVAALSIAITGFHSAPSYPFAGERSAAAYVESHLRPGDRILILHTDAYSYAYESKLSSTLHRAGGLLPFAPRFAGSRALVFGDSDASFTQAETAVRGARTVYVVATWYSENARINLGDHIGQVLTGDRFSQRSDRRFGLVNVYTWTSR